MDLIENFGLVWLLHLLPALVGSMPLWLLGRHHVHWLLWEGFAVLTIPFLVWLCLIFVEGMIPDKNHRQRGKGISNIFWESLLLGCCVPLAGVIRLVLANRFNEEYTAIASVVVISLAAVALWRFVPTIVGK